MANDNLLARACESNEGYLLLGNENFEVAGAMFVRNRLTPRRRAANHVGLIRVDAPDQLDLIIRRAEDEFDGFPHRSFGIDPLTPPAAVARLAMEEGYRTSEGLVMLLEGDLAASVRSLEISEVLTEDDWKQYRELDKLWWLETGTGEDALGPYSVEHHDEHMLDRRVKAPDVRGWFACVDGESRAFLSSWPGENGVGVVEDLFCHPDYRHRGLATALLAHCVADARSRGAGPVIINADPKETPKHMYAAMGFRPYYVSRSLWQNVSEDRRETPQ
jgi:GNAT superfamily N-acetyltransferase